MPKSRLCAANGALQLWRVSLLGFQKIGTSLLRDGRFSPSQFRVLLALISYMPAVFPSVRQLEQDTGMCHMTVRRALDALRDLGVLAWQGRGMGRVYTILAPEEWEFSELARKHGHKRAATDGEILGQPPEPKARNPHRYGRAKKDPVKWTAVTETAFVPPEEAEDFEEMAWARRMEE